MHSIKCFTVFTCAIWSLHFASMMINAIVTRKRRVEGPTRWMGLDGGWDGGDDKREILH
jgi:hypothetical protein